MAKPRKPHTRLEIRMSVELYNWLKDYSNRTGQSMAAIIKAPLESRRREDLKARRTAQREAAK